MIGIRLSGFRHGGGLALLVGLVLAVAAMAGSARAAAGPAFPALTGRVVDGAHMLSPAAQQKLEGELATLESSTGHQLVVATVPDLQGYEIEDYGYQLGRAWGLGRKGINDGAILLVAPNQRKVRIEVGYGLEPVLTDALSNVILQRVVLPQFRAGHMEQGVVDGAEALIRQLSLPEADAKANVARAAQAPPAQPQGSTGLHIPVILIILLVFWVLSGVLRGRGGGGLWWLLPVLFSGGGRGGGWNDGGGGGGFSGGGGSFGGGGSSGSW